MLRTPGLKSEVNPMSEHCSLVIFVLGVARQSSRKCRAPIGNPTRSSHTGPVSTPKIGCLRPMHLSEPPPSHTCRLLTACQRLHLHTGIAGAVTDQFECSAFYLRPIAHHRVRIMRPSYRRVAVKIW